MPRRPQLQRQEQVIANNRNQMTFAKRQREQDKKRKAEDKLARRAQRKEAAGSSRGAPEV